MTLRKVYCELVEGLVYESRCLYKLCQVTKDSKTCDCCILRELEKLKATGTKAPNDTNDINDTNGIKDINDIGNRSRQKTEKKSAKRRGKKESRSIEGETSNRMYSLQELSKLLGRAGRTVQEMAQRGKIPAVRVGIKWQFPKEEIDRWLSDKKDDRLKTSEPEKEEEEPEFPKSDFIHENQGEPEKEA